MADLFDPHLLAQRRDRAARMGLEPFLFERVFEDCLERIGMAQQRFASAVLLGCPIPSWRDRLASAADKVSVADPGEIFAARAGGQQLIEDRWQPAPTAYDLILTIGTLDTVNELPHVLGSLRRAMLPGGLFIGAFAGADTLPQLRAAMLAADIADGGVRPHVHPRIEASAVAPLLEMAGFTNPVVDVERVPVAYPSLARLVDDLRRMGATNVLTSRSGPLSRSAFKTASAAFAAAGDGSRTTEIIEIVHFAAWCPAAAVASLQ
jgi:NADH dehydrogenase [ubiquinone] 1 alpha subcomplex assembly factor 5